MRIFNGKDSQVNLPLSNGQRISIAPHSVSGDIMPSTEFLSLMVSSFGYDEIALIVAGPFEINMCSQVSALAGMVANSLEEAIQRFSKPEVVEKNPLLMEAPQVLDKPLEEDPNAEKPTVSEVVITEAIDQPEAPVVEPVVEPKAPKAKGGKGKKKD